MALTCSVGVLCFGTGDFARIEVRRRCTNPKRRVRRRQIVVEEVAVPGPELSHARRLVFVSNSNLIQSEARLRPRHQPGSAAGSQVQGKKKKGKPASQGAGAATGPLQLDHSILGMEYHKALVAGMSLISALSDC